MPKIPLLVFHLVFSPLPDDGDQHPQPTAWESPSTQNRWIPIYTDLSDPELPVLTISLHILKLTIFYLNKSGAKLPAFCSVIDTFGRSCWKIIAQSEYNRFGCEIGQVILCLKRKVAYYLSSDFLSGFQVLQCGFGLDLYRFSKNIKKLLKNSVKFAGFGGLNI